MGRQRTESGLRSSAFLSQGFRPFFLLASVYTALTVLAWVPAFEGRQEVISVFEPVDWHIHEMLFGFLPAVVTGFLLTALPNWTGRLPINGGRLLFLLVLWIAGRFAIGFSVLIGPFATALIDCSFLLIVTLAVLREIVVGENWRNLKVLAPLIILFLANTLYHLEVQTAGGANYSRRLGLSAAVILIMLIGGRIIPSFTRKWLCREKPGRLPVPFNQLDVLIVVWSIAALIYWTLQPEGRITGTLLFGAGLFNVLRILRWAGDRTLEEPLVLILHLGFAFVPVGLLLLSFAALWPDGLHQAAGVHALGAGAIGCMTIAVMTRVTLRHTGRALVTGDGDRFIFIGVIASAILRVLGSLGFDQGAYLIHLSGLVWIAVFASFAYLYGPAFFRTN